MRKYATFSDIKTDSEQRKPDAAPQGGSLFCGEPEGVTKWKLIADIPLDDLHRLIESWRSRKAILPPCKVGQKCWWVSGRTIVAGQIDAIVFNGEAISVIAYGRDKQGAYYHHSNGLPYFSIAEAEAALTTRLAMPQGDRAAGLPAEKEKGKDGLER